EQQAKGQEYGKSENKIVRQTVVFGNRGSGHGSGQDIVYNIARHIGKPKTAALVLVYQLFVVDAHGVQQGGVKIIDMHGVVHYIVPELVRFPKGDPGLDPPTGHPDTERPW